MSLAERRWLRLFTLCVLYVAQGIPWGFMATTLPAYLTKHGVKDVGAALGMTTLPYAFKWIWGPVIDTVTIRRFGRRRPWIIFAQAMMALTVLAMVAFDVTTNLHVVVWMIFFHTIFNALQDVSVDALAVDILPDDERGGANGLMYASKYAGGAIGGIGMAMLVTWFSLDVALVVQTSILLAIMLVPLLVRERSGEPAPREPVRVVASGLLQAFSLRSTVVATLLMLGANFAIGMIVATGYQLFIGKLGWGVDDYTAIGGGWGLGVGCACAAGTGFLTDRFGRRRVAAIASCALALGWIAFSQLESYWAKTWFVYAVGFYSEACQAIWSVALIALCMDVSWPRVAGSQFTAYMALSNFSTTLGYQSSGRINTWLSFQHVYILAGVIQIAVTLLLLPIDPHETRTKLPLPEGRRANWLAITTIVALLGFLIAMTVRSLLAYL
ncbi:MAG TPA: MFS transporter [Kofleriaceae bacterium]|nr:MFS transporter [Kofleriaceae bacterium]